MESGTAQAKSVTSYEGLNEKQNEFLRYLAQQLDGKDTAGFKVEVVSTVCWRYDNVRHMWVLC